jgi:ABC-type lipoprotein export system ATPase subunit
LSIRFDGVSKRRGTGRRSVCVLRDVSFRVESGEVVLLFGPSGSGKTTLLALAAGLLSPEAGRIEIGGRRIDGTSQASRRAMRSAFIGFVFQRPSLLGSLTARENVRLMARVAGLNAADAARETEAVLERLGIAGLASRLPRELSGGEEQRVGIARALVHRPAVLLADEPTGSLDSVAGAAVAELLRQAAHDSGASVLVATHDTRMNRYASRRMVMSDGRLVS